MVIWREFGSAIYVLLLFLLRVRGMQNKKKEHLLDPVWLFVLFEIISYDST